MEGKIALEEHFALEETLRDELYKVWFAAWDDMRRRLDAVRARIDTATQRAGRSAETVTLVAVSKRKPPASMNSVSIPCADRSNVTLSPCTQFHVPYRDRNQILRWTAAPADYREAANDIIAIVDNVKIVAVTID